MIVSHCALGWRTVCEAHHGSVCVHCMLFLCIATYASNTNHAAANPGNWNVWDLEVVQWDACLIHHALTRA